MNLIDALAFTEQKRLQGHKFDGCTLAPDFGIKKWCDMHDALRRFRVVPNKDADILLFKGIWSEGVRYWPIAVLYFIAVRAAYFLRLYE